MKISDKQAKEIYREGQSLLNTGVRIGTYVRMKASEYSVSQKTIRTIIHGDQKRLRE